MHRLSDRGFEELGRRLSDGLFQDDVEEGETASISSSDSSI